MRLFAAIFPPKSLLEPLAEIIENAKSSYAGGTLVAPDRLHFTVRFFGEFDVRTAESIIEKAVVNQPAFDVTMDHLGAFPSLGRARVLFLGTRDNPELGKLIANATAPGDRPPHAHLTIARLKDQRRIEPFEIQPLTFQADSVKLVDSILGREPRYEVLREWHLG